MKKLLIIIIFYSMTNLTAMNSAPVIGYQDLPIFQQYVVASITHRDQNTRQQLKTALPRLFDIVDPNAVNQYGISSLTLATKLLEKKVTPAGRDIATDASQVVNILLDCGANPLLGPSCATTPFLIAARNPEMEDMYITMVVAIADQTGNCYVIAPASNQNQ